MECPRCGTAADSSPHACQHCGFSLVAITETFGLDLVELKSFADDAHCLRLQEAHAVEELIADFEEKFPQVFITIYIGVLPPQLSVGQLAFLLLNRGVFSNRDRLRLNEHAVTLVLDPVARSAGLMVGYALEKFLPAQTQKKILRSVRTPLWHGEYAPAIAIVLQAIEKTLRKSARREWKTHSLPPVSAEDFISSSGFRALRSSASAPKPTDAKNDESVIDGGDDSFFDRKP
ncbi:MAG: hypothetical protein WCN98_10715 [Verrucomicrobiaceae bacterium]